MVRLFRIIGSPAFPPDEDERRALYRAIHDRGHSRRGVTRQLMAIARAGDRTAALAAVAAPTVVIHGRDDPLLPVAAGEATARAITGARLVTIAGMGHDLPPAVWPTVVEAIVDNARRATAAVAPR